MRRNHSAFEKTSVETSLSIDDLRSANFSAIDVLRENFRDGLRDNMIAGLFGSITEATADQPNVTLDINGDIRPGLISSLESISIGLSDTLQPIFPTIALPNSLHEKFITKLKELEQNDSEFMKRYELLKHRKWLEALIVHFENRLKFKLSDHERSTIRDGLQRLQAAKESLLLREGCRSIQGELISG